MRLLFRFKQHQRVWLEVQHEISGVELLPSAECWVAGLGGIIVSGVKESQVEVGIVKGRGQCYLNRSANRAGHS